MRTWIIGAAAILAVAVPSVAAAQTGYVGALYSNADVEGADESDAWGVEGAVAFPGSSSISFEVDAAIVDGDDDTAYGLTGHIYNRTDSYLFGGFVGLADSDESDGTTWTAGLEANMYYTNWTLAGALYYSTNDGDTTDADMWGLNVQPRLFVNDNFRLQANLGWATFDSSTGDDDVMNYGVGGEFQFATMPISIGASYDRIDGDDSGLEADIVSVALRYNWGGTLRDRDRNGASQAGIRGPGLRF